MAKPSYFIGLMSGTSLDGVDAVLVEFKHNTPALISTHSHPISNQLRTKIIEVIQPDWRGSVSSIGVLNQQLGELFAAASLQLIKKSGVSIKDIQAIGSHGQTIWHQPTGASPFSLQLGDANLIAEQTKVTTIADFRGRDIAAGGQGAPLVPAFHQALFSNQSTHRILLNIGGLANVTLLPKDGGVSGFDTGPGNGLMDAWIKEHKQQPYDKNGAWANSGMINTKILEQLLDDAYFSLPAPKSTGKEYFNLEWLDKKIPINASTQDVQATLTALTAQSIADAIKQATNNQTGWHELYVFGGGIHNPALMMQLQKHLADYKIESTEKLGVSPDWMEAIAFAWLAKQTLEGKSGNLAAVTGAKGPRVLGAIYHC